MPNGGSDCCATCWFNKKNKGEVGYGHTDDPEPAYCTIRDLPIDHPFYTYCGNHPHRRPQKDPVPIGPVYTGDSSGTRFLWKPSPDSEEIRLHLLELLGEMQEQPSTEYPIGIYSDELIIWQLGEFRETRALDLLHRISKFNPDSKETGPFLRTRKSTVQMALAAIEKIEAT